MNLFGKITPGARMTALTLAGDTLALVLAAFVAVGMRFFFDGQFELILYIRLLPALSLFYALFALRGLYPGVLLSPPDELKRRLPLFSFPQRTAADTPIYTLTFFLLPQNTTVYFLPHHRPAYNHRL